MQSTVSEEMSCLLRDAIMHLTPLEAAYIEECHLSEPRISLKAFSEAHGLRQKEMTDLRVRAIRRLQEELATKNVYGLADIL
jgi:hypothetical protein